MITEIVSLNIFMLDFASLWNANKTLSLYVEQDNFSFLLLKSDDELHVISPCNLSYVLMTNGKELSVFSPVNGYCSFGSYAL